VTTINGNVTAPAGTSCTPSFVNITGNVRVGQNATLVVSALVTACWARTRLAACEKSGATSGGTTVAQRIRPYGLLTPRSVDPKGEHAQMF
jgi:hypothetical protein